MGGINIAAKVKAGRATSTFWKTCPKYRTRRRASGLRMHRPSKVIDPRAYTWNDAAWIGRLWEECVNYELHIGTFTQQGTFRAAIERIGWLADLGITAIEIMYWRISFHEINLDRTDLESVIMDLMAGQYDNRFGDP
jgi:pullulanase/glycogen debranching enzyme